MLINCPRCGFSQPKDQYCANCGINIEKYTPQKISFLKKFFSNTFIQAALVIASTLAISFFVLKTKNKDELVTRSLRKKITSPATMSATSNQIYNQANTQSEKLAVSKSDSPQNLQNQEKPIDISVAVQNESQRNQIAGNEAPPSSMTSMDFTKKTNSENNQSIAIKYSYYEIDRNLLHYWVQLNHQNQTGAESESDFEQIGTISSDLFKKEVHSEPLKTETKKISLKQKEIFNAGISRDNSDSYIGFSSEIKFDSITNNDIAGVIRISKKNNQLSELVNYKLKIKQKDVFFIHWKNDLNGFENETALFRVPPFQILQSPKFKIQKTDLVIIIEPYF